MRKIILFRIGFFLIIFFAFAEKYVDFASAVGMKPKEIMWIGGIFLLVIYFFLDTAMIMHLLHEPITPPFLKELILKGSGYLVKIGIKITPSEGALFDRLTKVLRGYDKDHLTKIRMDIKKHNIAYLQPLEPSSAQWGNLFYLWETKLLSSENHSGIRWALLSDLYLNQEIKDFNDGKFVTDLDLYAKTILLNLLLSIYQRSEENIVVWVFTKMLPTDWPLCKGACTKDPECASFDSNSDDIFLQGYINSLRQCATMPRFADHIDFCRHILVTPSNHHHFRTCSQLDRSLSSHKEEYFQALHASTL